MNADRFRLVDLDGVFGLKLPETGAGACLFAATICVENPFTPQTICIYLRLLCIRVHSR